MTESKPTVSVIIPTYNRAGMVGAAIESLLAQTRRPAQIIVVDDGSTDDTPDVLARYSGGITAIYQENRGRSAARNMGLLHAASDYVAFLDSDDTLPQESIALRADVLDSSPNVDIVYGDAWLEDSVSKKRICYSDLHRGEHPSGFVFPSLAQGALAPIHCFMFRRACLDKLDRFDVTLDTLEDHDFWLRLCTHTTFAYLDVPIATYIVHPGMTTLTMRDKMREGRLIVQKRAVEMPEFGSLTVKQEAAVYVSIGSTCLALRRTDEAREWLRTANQTSSSPGGALLYALSFLGARGIKPVLALRRKLRALLQPETRMFYG